MWRLTPIFAAALLAGCLAAEAPLDATADLAEALVPDVLVYATCAERLGVFPIPIDDAREGLPEGFEPLTLDPAGNRGLLAVVAWDCATARPGGDDAREVMVGVVVDAPDAYANPDAAFHVVLREHLVTNEGARAVYAAWGSLAQAGEVEIEDEDVPAGEASTSRARGNDTDLIMHTVAAQEGGEAAGIARMFTVDGGAVAAMYEIAWETAAGWTGEAFLDGAFGAPPKPPRLAGFGYHYEAEGDRYTMRPIPLPTA